MSVNYLPIELIMSCKYWSICIVLHKILLITLRCQLRFWLSLLEIYQHCWHWVVVPP